MNDNFPNDIVPPEKKRSVRDIPLPSKNKDEQELVKKDVSGIHDIQHNPKKTERKDALQDTYQASELGREFAHEKPLHTRKPEKKLWLFLILVAIILLIGYFFASRIKSEITVHPRTATVSVDIQKTGIESGVESSATQTLPFTKINRVKQASQVVEANTKEYVEKKASGKIIVYNEFSESDYSLIKNTRFETPEGLIYRVPHSITIPGKTIHGDDVTPGSLEIEVFADDIGESYNIGLKDFTIPGFKGLTQFDQFYARSKTSMSGGFAGEQYVVKEEDLEEVEQQLQEKLRNELTADIRKLENFVYVHETEGFEFNLLPQVVEGNDGANVTLEGTLLGLQFNSEDLKKVIIEDALESSTNIEMIDVENLKDLTISVDESESGVITLNISGNAELLWDVDTEQLKESLRGIQRSDLNTVLQSFEGVARAETSLPFWSSKVSRNPNKILVILNEKESIDE